MNALSRSMAMGLAGLLAAGWLEAGAQSVTGTFERTLEIDGPVELDVRTGAGGIAVRQGSAGQVRIVGRIEVRPRFGRSAAETEALVRRFETEPPVEVSGNQVGVGFGSDGEYREFWGNVLISYQIEVPRETALTSRTGSGSQEVAGVSGPVQAAAGSGSIVVNDVGGRVELRTGSGSIRADGIAGPIDADTGSGSVTLVQTVAGDVSVSTGSGSADLRGISGALRARTGSGRIEVQGQPSGRWDLETGSGSIRIELPPDAAFELDAHTGSGRIETEHPVAVRGAIERGRLGGEVRGGGPLLRARTGSGSITIE